MGCVNPVPVSGPDVQAILNQYQYKLSSAPPWGTLIVYNGRLILAYNKPDGTWVLTDISGGIPYVNAPNGCIPASVFVTTFSKGEYISPTEAFFMSLPSNFVDVALERYHQMIAAGETIATDTGDIVGSVITPLAKPLTDLLWPLAVVAAVVLAVMYLPKK